VINKEPWYDLNIQINYFITFKTVAKFGSFSEAAKKLMLSDGTVRHRVETLEKFFGAKLLDRYPKGIKVTQFGDLLLQKLNKLDDFITDLYSLKNIYQNSDKKNIRICAGEIAIFEIVPKVIKAFKKENKEIDIFIESNHARDCIKKLLLNEVDIAIVGEFMFPEFKNQWRKLETYNILETPLCVIVPASSPLALRKQISLNEIKDMPLIRRTPGSATQAIIDKLIGKNLQSNNKFYFEVETASALIQAVSLNLGIGIVSEVQAKKFSKPSKVKILKLDPPLKVKLKVAIKKKNNKAIVKKFLEYIMNNRIILSKHR
jgi:DNA-binding transcriptional LysR family regulator